MKNIVELSYWSGHWFMIFSSSNLQEQVVVEGIILQSFSVYTNIT